MMIAYLMCQASGKSYPDEMFFVRHCPNHNHPPPRPQFRRMGLFLNVGNYAVACITEPSTDDDKDGKMKIMTMIMVILMIMMKK